MISTFDRIRQILVDHLAVSERSVTLDASIIDDLGADSLDLVELVMAFEEEFDTEISDKEAETWILVSDVVRAAEKIVAG